MVSVAQLVRASGCGPEGHGFESHHSPQRLKKPCFALSNNVYGIRNINMERILIELWSNNIEEYKKTLTILILVV